MGEGLTRLSIKDRFIGNFTKFVTVPITFSLSKCRQNSLFALGRFIAKCASEAEQLYQKNATSNYSISRSKPQLLPQFSIVQTF